MNTNEPARSAKNAKNIGTRMTRIKRILKFKMDENILWGLGSLLIGIFSIWFTKKYPTKGQDIWLLDIKGYLGAEFVLL